jgi:hypothetical protein
VWGVTFTEDRSLEMGNAALIHGQISEEQFDTLRSNALRSHQGEWEKFFQLNYPKVAADEWYSKVDTGDILLFKCMQASSKYFKEIQGSHYSHGLFLSISSSLSI